MELLGSPNFLNHFTRFVAVDHQAHTLGNWLEAFAIRRQLVAPRLVEVDLPVFHVLGFVVDNCYRPIFAV